MRLTPMRFKEFTWPHNPEVYTVEYRRRIAVHEAPFGECVMQELGSSFRILKGEGAFAGEDAYARFKELAAVFQEEGPGLLVHPVWQTERAYFTSLEAVEEPRPDYVRYRFEFWEDGSGYSGGLTATVCGRGYAARLLDNESRPITYQQATLAEILRNHVEPYGVSCGEAAELRAGSVYTVAAGSSQWKAVDSFCRAYGCFSPRFSREGKLLAGPEREGKTLSIGEGDPVLSCSLREDHYGVLTEA